MYNIGLIGCGKWSDVVIANINENHHFNLKSITCRNFKKIKKDFSNFYIFHDYKSMIDSNIIDCVYIAADPETNKNVFDYVKNRKMPLILEKPLAKTLIESEEIKNFLIKDKFPVFINLPNIYSKNFLSTKKFFNKNKSQIDKIIFYEGGFGPFRKNINPIWDWGTHSLPFILKLFAHEKLIKIKKTEIKKNKSYSNGLVCRIDLLFYSGIKVKIIVGNLFKNKIRKLKILLKNNSFFENDMINGNIFIDNVLINESNFNPFQLLLDRFYFSIKNGYIEEDFNNIKISSNSIKILESFYNC